MKGQLQNPKESESLPEEKIELLARMADEQNEVDKPGKDDQSIDHHSGSNKGLDPIHMDTENWYGLIH